MRFTLIFIFLFAISCNPINHNSIPENISSNEDLQKHLLQGWNTWNNPNLLSFVHMPDGLSLRMTFRKKRGGPYWVDQAYIIGPKIDFAEKVEPVSHAYDGSYIAMNFSWAGMEATIQTAHDGNDIVILYQPKKVPENPHVLILETGYLWNKPGVSIQKDGFIENTSDDYSFEVRTTSVDENYLFPLSSPYISLSSNQECGFYTGPEKSLDEIKSIISKHQKAFEDNPLKYNNLSDAYESMQAVISWNTIYDAANHRAISPVSRVWNETWGGYIIFDWDTYFTAVMLAIDQKELAYSNAIAITNSITENGFIPNLESSFGNKSFDRSQPPVGSMCVKLIYDKYQEDWFLKEVFDNLLTWNRWWPKARDNQGYLSWGSDDHPSGMSGHSKQGAKWESGLDNSPLFDDAVFNPEKNVLELADAGLMGLYIADCNYLADIAEILGNKEVVKELKERASKYSVKLQELWDVETGMYRDKYTDRNEFSTHLAPTNFYPLIAGVPSQEQAQRMIDEHFFNREEFFGEFIIPSIARNDPGFKDNSYWRGRIWAPMNFLVYMGLRNYDLPEARKEMVEKSLNLIMKEWHENRRVHENYNSVTGVGGDVRNSNSFYAWGGLLGFIPLMEEGYY